MAQQRTLVNKFFSLNWSLVGLMTIMLCIGFAMLYSAAEGNMDPWASKQMIRFAVLFPVMIAIALIDIRIWLKYSYVIYGLALVMLFLVLVGPLGVKAMGATRWIRLGPINVQPSEIMKICLMFALARYFHTTSMVNVHRVVHLILPILMVAAPVCLILLQPDLGTALILVMAATAVFFVAGVKWWKFVAVGCVGLASLPLIWHFMHDYQKQRVLSFLNPESDKLGAGYNILQSKIAIGSGGFSGKGFLEGTQSQLSFLPEKQTDFIFTMLAEEFGFMGGASVIALYGIIIAFGIIISVNSANHFGRLLAMGITSVFSLHVFVNIAMVMGMIPVVGAPLPLLSYGGTIMMSMMIAFGLLLNVHLYGDQKLEQDRAVVR